MLLNSFISVSIKDNFKRDFANRPQRVNEPLSLYAIDIKENFNVLKCNYTEVDFVNIIKMGINQEDRGRLIVMRNPVLNA